MGGRVKILSQFCLLRWRWCCQRTEGEERREGGGHVASVVRVTVVAKTPQDSLRLLHVARCRVYFCCVCKVMELVCIDFAVAGGVVGGRNVAQVDCQGKVFSIFRIFIASPSFPCCVPRCQSTNCFHFAPLRDFWCRRQVKQLQPPCPFPSSPPSPWEPFVPFGAASFSIDFRGFAAKQSRGAKANSTCPSLLCVCVFFSSIFGQCCTYDLCSLLLLLLLFLLLPRRFFVRSDP